MRKNASFRYILLATGIILCLCSAGCISSGSLDDTRLLLEFQDQGTIYLPNITSYMASEASLLGLNLSEKEISYRAAEIAEKYSGRYNSAQGRYEVNWNEFHLSLGRAYGMTDDEIRRYVEATSGKKVYGQHNLPVPKNIYKNVLDRYLS